MKIVIVGSGIAGMSAAIQAASEGIEVEMISPFPSERAQSVMAAGGINAVNADFPEDSIESHVQDTYKGGCFIEDPKDLENLCGRAPEHLKFIEELGVVFSRDKNHKICRRAFGGQSHKRTAYAGSSTGKQIVTALVQKCREFEKKGAIKRILGLHFHSAFIKDGRCYGVLMMDELTGELHPHYADAVIMATGGLNKLFGKTTGTELCDGYATGRLFSQGVELRNLEFIQYHPTSIETPHKRMLITEAARGEGGRLYYLKDGERVYFMEDLYGEKGNLMPRDIVAKCIYDCPSQVYLDIAFLGKKLIFERLREVYDLCKEYINLDVTKESIPVAPSVHFFMGGIAVDFEHQTNIKGLYAVGECASKYHGANRLGGNSLLAAVHSGRTAAESCAKTAAEVAETESGSFDMPSFEGQIELAKQEMKACSSEDSRLLAENVLKELSVIMNGKLGITRCEDDMAEGINQVDHYLATLPDTRFDPDISVYENIRPYYMMLLAKAALMSAKSRKETRGAHIRDDYPQTLDEFKKCSYAEYKDDEIAIAYR